MKVYTHNVLDETIERDPKRLAAFDAIKTIENELQRIEQFTDRLTQDLQPYLYSADAKPTIGRPEEAKDSAGSQLMNTLRDLHDYAERQANRLLDLLERVQ